MIDFCGLITECKALAKHTGTLLLQFWNQQRDFMVRKKSDGTPVSEADLAAHQLIKATLQRLTPDIPILSEEDDIPSFEQRQLWREYWLIDPLDGTRGFLEHDFEFSVNIALIRQHQPVIGLLYIPNGSICYYAWQGGGAFKQISDQPPISLTQFHKNQPKNWKVLIGKYSRGKKLATLIGNTCDFQILRANGSIKYGMLADRAADLYPRLSPIYEWDTGAGQCILEQSGGCVVDLQGKALQYNRKPSLQTGAFIALADSNDQDFWLKILKGEIS
ncbi:MAG: 3'(2'),5'-bisphosphate nucleotidase CysQ [Proteobacteria bacterium]|nr:3'(2'),5'-bisphosphate nucleotidase CysQ [Pseudomonadota bacterium]